MFLLHTLPHVSTINPQRGVRRGLCDREMGTLIRNLGEILVRTLWGCLKTYFSEARLIFLPTDRPVGPARGARGHSASEARVNGKETEGTQGGSAQRTWAKVRRLVAIQAVFAPKSQRT